MTVISIMSNKGGVGKTTISINLAAALVRQGKKVLCVDFDPQACMSRGLGFVADESTITIKDMLEKVLNQEAYNPNDGMMQHGEGMYLMPANIDLQGFEKALFLEMGNETILKQYIDNVKQDYDFVIIDGQPSLNLLILNVLTAVDSIIIPLQLSEYSVKGLQDYFKYLNMLKARGLNQRIQIDGLLPSMVDGRLNESKEKLAEIHRDYADSYHVFFNPIPFTVRLSEISSKGISIFEHPDKSDESVQKAVQVFELLGKEVIDIGRKRREDRDRIEQPTRNGKKLKTRRAKGSPDKQVAHST